MEQGTGVEPASEAWEATIIADILTLRDGKHYSTPHLKKQAEFFDRVRPIILFMLIGMAQHDRQNAQDNDMSS